MKSKKITLITLILLIKSIQPNEIIPHPDFDPYIVKIDDKIKTTNDIINCNDNYEKCIISNMNIQIKENFQISISEKMIEHIKNNTRKTTKFTLLFDNVFINMKKGSNFPKVVTVNLCQTLPSPITGTYPCWVDLKLVRTTIKSDKTFLKGRKIFSNLSIFNYGIMFTFGETSVSFWNSDSTPIHTSCSEDIFKGFYFPEIMKKLKCKKSDIINPDIQGMFYDEIIDKMNDEEFADPYETNHKKVKI